MTSVARFLSLAILAASLPSCLAGPACSRREFMSPDCLVLCKTKWGWPGKHMGKNRWGSVLKNVDSNEAWEAMLSKACGLESTASVAPTQPVGNAQSGSVTPSSAATSIITTSGSSAVASPVVSTAISTSTISISSSSSMHSTPSSSIKPATSIHTFTTPTAISTPKPPATSAIRPPPTQATSTRQSPSVTTKVPAQSPTGGSSGGASGDVQAYLASHNAARAAHGASPLTWDDGLAGKAQQWANGCRFKHSGGTLGPYGENLAAGTGTSYGVLAAVKAWTDESSEYNPSNPQFSHFTQVVWKGTTQVGCAVQSCDGIFAASYGKAKYYVCEYFPAGNIEGQFAQNVQA